MSLPTLFAYAFLVGTVISACAVSLMELVARRPAGMRRPFVSDEHIFRSLAIISIAGPCLLICELRTARATEAVPVSLVIAGLLIANVWALALGIVLVEFMTVLSTPM